nr:uncharacterized protein LOC106046477 [Anser cygnoides]
MGEVPDDWKKVNDTSVMKKGKKDPGNYRQLVTPGKVMEELILETISRHIPDKEVIGRSQYRFGAARRSARPLPGRERRRVREGREPSSRPSLSVKTKAEEEGRQGAAPCPHPCLCNSFRTPGTRRGLRGGPGTEDAGCSTTFPLSQEGVFAEISPGTPPRSHRLPRRCEAAAAKYTSGPIPTPAGRSGEDARLLRAAGDTHPPAAGQGPARRRAPRGEGCAGKGRASRRQGEGESPAPAAGEEEGGTVSVGWSGNPVIKRGARGKSREKLRTRPLFSPSSPAPATSPAARGHLPPARHRTALHSTAHPPPSEAAFRGAPASVHARCEAGRHPQAIAMDFVMKQALGGATKDMGKMLGGDEEKDPDAAKKEEERQEALRQEEEERKAKYAKMEAEREVMRQGIRDKYGIKKKEEKEAEAQAALEANAEGSLTRPKKAIPPGCGDEEEEEEESILDTVIKYLPGPLQDMFKK